MKELEQSLQASEEKLKQSSDVVAAQEAQIQELVSGDHALLCSRPLILSFVPLKSPDSFPAPGMASGP